MTTNRRRFFAAVAAGVAGSALPGIAVATTPRQAVVATAWRGPNPGNSCFASALVADWETCKLDEWDTHGIDPHPLALDAAGPLIVANGGVPRTLAICSIWNPRSSAWIPPAAACWNSDDWSGASGAKCEIDVA